MAISLANRGRRLVVLLHRWLGIPLSAVFVVWFLSGIVMMYTGGMPALTDAERLVRALPIAFDAVRLAPAEAAAVAGFDESLDVAELTTVLGRPAYRFGTVYGRYATVFADTGQPFDFATVTAARTEAARFLGVAESALAHAETVTTPDQWTLAERGSLPLERFDLDDGSGTRVYVSTMSGAVALVTDTRSRALAWAGTIPHWFYFTPFRLNQPLWYWTVVWVAVAGCVLAVLGIVLAVIQLRRVRPFSIRKAVPYRGARRWHYWTGAIFGVFAFTWAFSGMLSMEPFEWTNATGLELTDDVLTGGPIEPADFPLPDERLAAAAGGRAVKRVELLLRRGQPFLLAHVTNSDGDRDPAARGRLHQPYPLQGTAGIGRVLIDAQSLAATHAAVPVASIVADMDTAAADAGVATYTLLDSYDSYYYSRERLAPLPVVRIEFDDPDRTWYYVDPLLGRIVGRVHRFSRLERWLFNGLHSLDFPFWYDRRPLWDIVMIGLSLGALATSGIGFYLGIRHLGSLFRRAAAGKAA